MLETESTPPFLSLVAPKLPLALEEIDVPCYVLDANGRIRWLNAAARDLVGDVTGQLFTAVVHPRDVPRARTRFAKNMQSEETGEFGVDIVGTDGQSVQVEISSVPLRSHERAIGIFGFARVRHAPRPAGPDDRLTPRQHEVLVLLSNGESTDQIARQLHLSQETVRNHVRHILRRLRVRSRLEAVAFARREHML